MNCKEFEKNIPEFIAGKLDFLTLQEFGEHMQECPGAVLEVITVIFLLGFLGWIIS